MTSTPGESLYVAALDTVSVKTTLVPTSGEAGSEVLVSDRSASYTHLTVPLTK